MASSTSNISYSPSVDAGWRLISATTASASSEVAFTGLKDDWVAFLVVFNEVGPATDSVYFSWQFGYGDSSSPTYWSGATDYGFNNIYSTSGQTVTNTDELFDTTIATQGNGASEKLYGILEISDFQSMSPSCKWAVRRGNTSGSSVMSHGGGHLDPKAEQCSALKFYYSSGNISGGTFYLYGLK